MNPTAPVSLRTRLVRRAQHFVMRFTRPMTLGVRALVLDAEGRIFLVRHSYVPGWYLPGGGVEAGQTLCQAMARELVEEGNIIVRGEPQLFGIYFNNQSSRRDHVALYVVFDFAQHGEKQPDWEIRETGFFSRDALPEGTTRATLARIAEVLDGVEASAIW